VRFIPCGDAALTIQFDEPPSAALTRRIAVLHDALPRGQAGVVECIPGLASLTVLFEPAAVGFDDVEAHVQRCFTDLPDSARATRRWRIPVCYEGDRAPDLTAVAAACGLDATEVAAAHCAREYVVYLLGFSPGFPYMGDLDSRLALPRRSTPREIVPRGSVAIATTYTAIYPQSTAGGWHIIGATPVTLFDAARAPPALMLSGDTVSFEPITRDDFDMLAREYAGGRALVPE
jgi:inhibitor of KinA